ncbi:MULTISPECIES: diaminopimelate epimerase [unclassified Cyanobium]|uniref:diaminopimelate epimerase n=1 Tax=unclassified Cyanobium TaxID=2627006 RepID=UPI0020CF940B|nr:MULTISPECIES: diaminopimelate epimerase [unclassified Cyanobium]
MAALAPIVLQFSKYQGLGNDFLMLDGRGASSTDASYGLTPDRIQRLCDRRFGVGADGVILALPPRQGGELRMRIFNADGTEPEMCGNGMRCLARFLADSDGDVPGRQWQIETLAGRIVPELRQDGRIRVDMGAPFLDPESIPTTLPCGDNGLAQGNLEVAGNSFAVGAAGMGNPHVVIPVDDVEAVDLERYGAAFEVHPAFPARTNVHFVQVIRPTHLVMRVWERGAGPTLACGTGACATLVVAHLLGLAERCARLDLPGGPLEIDWDEASGHVFMAGPAVAVFDGVVTPELWGDEPFELEAATPVQKQPHASPAVDCASVCTNGCIRPEACPSAEARARVDALLNSSSLDDLVALATNSLESRIRSRFERDPAQGG